MSELSADNPITDPADDKFGRAALAQVFVADILAQDARNGLVVGVLGPWGSGKTSFVNLARLELEAADAWILDFNPWMFSGTDQLVTSFFIELAAQLKLRSGFAQIAKDLEEYGEAVSGLEWLPFLGAWVARGRSAAKLARRILERRESRRTRQAQLEKRLRDLRHPIVVVLDDVDRLTTSEIRDIFKLVRLTASFPNIIYVVAFDRRRVEAALSEDGLSGRAYLEKILQLGYDLPTLPEHALRREVVDALEKTLGALDGIGEIDPETWSDLYMEIIDPLIHNMRDVRRYAAAARGTVLSLEGEIALGDVMAMEAIRVFLPDVFMLLPQSVGALTAASAWNSGDSEEAKKTVERLIAESGDQTDVVAAMIMRLFPAAQRHLPRGVNYGADWANTWLRQHRIAHETFFRLYLERVAGVELVAFRAAERAWTLLDDRVALDEYLKGLAPDVLEDVISNLEAYESEFQPGQVVPASVVLLNLLPHIPSRPRGMFDMDTRMVVGRVVYRLVRSPDDPAKIKAAVDEILLDLDSLSSAFELLTDVGYREGAGHELVSESDAAALEKAWRARVREASASQLAAEWDLLRILLFTKNDALADEEPLNLPRSPEVTLALVRSAQSEVRGQSDGSRAVRRSGRLYWDGLVELYGDERTLLNEIDTLKASGLPIEPELLDLVDRYASGWRPSDFTSQRS